MDPVNWNTYHQTHYKPLHGKWSIDDVKKYLRWYKPWIRYIQSKVDFHERQRAFEIGSGIGATTALLSETGLKITGSDIASEIVQYARDFHPSLRFMVCDIEKGIPGNQQFEYIFGFEVLEHLHDPIHALEIIRSRLQSGGYFIGTSPYPFEKNLRDPTHTYVLHPQSWKAIFRKAGFSIVESFPMSFIPFVWRLVSHVHIVLPYYIHNPFFVSTTLLIAQK